MGCWLTFHGACSHRLGEEPLVWAEGGGGGQVGLLCVPGEQASHMSRGAAAPRAAGLPRWEGPRPRQDNGTAPSRSHMCPMHTRLVVGP